MPEIYTGLAWEDTITLRLRTLYERHGYGRYRMGKFEPYDMYLENRNFLKSAGVITFTDANGKLMALKPDVTMSIVKNTPVDAVSRKLYYTENVFRMAHGSNEYREISQIGVESIGSGDLYSEAEVLLLALETLGMISNDYLLCIGDMEIIDALLRMAGLSGDNYDKALAFIRQKNVSGFDMLCEKCGVSDEKRALLSNITIMSASVDEGIALLDIPELPVSAKERLTEIKALYGILKDNGYADRLRMDFSIINDMDYYNGIVFRGYIPGAPRAVLSGGRYDNLMRRLGKPQSAIGFALYSGELSRMFSKIPEFDADVLVIYGDASPEDISRTVLRVSDNGRKSVRTEKYPNADIKARETVVIEETEVLF